MSKYIKNIIKKIKNIKSKKKLIYNLIKYELNKYPPLAPPEPLYIKNIYNKLKKIDIIEVKYGKNKGSRGQFIEKILGLKNNNNLKDMIDGELKTCKENESVACTQLNHCFDEIMNDIPYEESKLGKKMKNVIYCIFSKNNYLIKNILVNKKNNLKYHNKIIEDYYDICNYVKNTIINEKKLRTFNGRNKLLQIRTKASKNKKTGLYTPLIYNGHKLNNKYMAFYLRNKYVKILLQL